VRTPPGTLYADLSAVHGAGAVGVLRSIPRVGVGCARARRADTVQFLCAVFAQPCVCTPRGLHCAMCGAMHPAQLLVRTSAHGGKRFGISDGGGILRAVVDASCATNRLGMGRGPDNLPICSPSYELFIRENMRKPEVEDLSRIANMTASLPQGDGV
jgi:hypothetical protein